MMGFAEGLTMAGWLRHRGVGSMSMSDRTRSKGFSSLLRRHDRQRAARSAEALQRWKRLQEPDADARHGPGQEAGAGDARAFNLGENLYQ